MPAEAPATPLQAAFLSLRQQLDALESRINRERFVALAGAQASKAAADVIPEGSLVVEVYDWYIERINVRHPGAIFRVNSQSEVAIQRKFAESKDLIFQKIESTRRVIDYSKTTDRAQVYG